MVLLGLFTLGAWGARPEQGLLTLLGWRRRLRLEALSSPGFLLLGEPFEGSLQLDVRAGVPVERVRWKLRCGRAQRFERSVTTRHGKQTCYRWETDWRTAAEGEVELPPGRLVGPLANLPLRFSAVVPPEAPPSLWLENRQVLWRLVIKATGGGETVRAEREFEVLPYVAERAALEPAA